MRFQHIGLLLSGILVGATWHPAGAQQPRGPAIRRSADDSVRDAFCPRRANADSTTVLIGHLQNASTRGAIADGVVTAQWLSIVRTGKHINTAWPTVTTRSRADGSYALCDLPAGTQIAVQAASGDNTSGVITIVTAARHGIIRRELYVSDRAAPRSGTITGVVESAIGQQPIARAQVRVAGVGEAATTGPDGRFTLRGVPYGTLAIQARSLGFAPQERDVDVLADAPGRVTFSMSAVANVLDTVRTYALLSVNDANGFNQRRAAGWGRYFDANDIKNKHAFDDADIFRGVPGVTVTGMRSDSRILMKSLFPIGGAKCQPNFFLDGNKLTGIASISDLEFFVHPDELAGVEVYDSPLDTPGQFKDWGTCGAVVMWSLPPQLINRRNGR